MLTNFREDITPYPEARSRGEIIKTFLTQPAHWPTFGFLELLDDLSDVGGFTMVFGNPARQTYPARQMFGVLSNRSEEWKEGRVINVLGKGSKETIGVSNGGFGEPGWKKVDLGREMMMGVVEKDVLRSGEAGGVGGSGEKVLVEELFRILSTDTLPKRDVDVGWDGYMKEFRNSIFIPAVCGEGDGKGKGDGMSGIYGTQKQSIVLVDKEGHVTFVERTLYDDNAEPLKGGARDKRFEFDVEKWDECYSSQGPINIETGTSTTLPLM